MSKQAHSSFTPTASVATVLAMLGAAAGLGLSRNDLLSGRVVEDLSDRDARVSLKSVIALYDAIEQRLGPATTINIGERLPSVDESIVGYLCQRSRTVRELFENVARYSALTMQTGSPGLDIRAGRAWFGWAAGSSSGHPGLDALCLVWWTASVRLLLRRDWMPSEVHLRCPDADVGLLEAWFGSSVHREDASGTWLVFDARLLDTALSPKDDSLATYLRPVAEGMLARLDNSRTFAGTVRECLQRLLFQDGSWQDGSWVAAAGIDDVARALAMSARTVQRRLENEGTTFGAVIDHARRERALECLRNPKIAIKEAAWRVGFSEPSTFYRAVRRWTGNTPAAYRRGFAG